MTRPATVVINLSALRSNLGQIRRLAPEQRIMAIIKADAYGHGLIRIGGALSDVDALGVACLEEARLLRDAGITQRIIVLEGPFSSAEIAELQSLGIELMLHHASQLPMLEQASPSPALAIWLKIDSGMHRLGFSPEDLDDVYAQICSHPAVQTPPVLVTHLASANEGENDFVQTQLACFQQVTRNMEGERCIANSAALLGWPETHADWIRPGLAMYGISPFVDSVGQELNLQPVMTLSSELIAVRDLVAGDTVGYGRTWCCPERMRVGVVAIGYGDGYPRHAEPGTPILVNGQQVSLIGRPSMDMLTVDLRNTPDAQVGDPVVLWGPDLPVEEIARCASTIPYELLCNVGRRSRIEVIDR